MREMSRVLDEIRTLRVVPVVSIDDPVAAMPLGEALMEAGLPVVEVTFRTSHALSAIRRLATQPNMLVGAGTVLRSDHVDQAIDAGAQFIVSPGLSAQVAQRCRELEVLYFPGISTATEVMAAKELGLDTLKLFPAEAIGGLAMLRALAAPFPDVRFLPTGGIDAASAGMYLDVPSVVAVGGSWMVPPGSLRDGQWGEIRALTTQAVRIGQRLEDTEGTETGRKALHGRDS